MILVEAGECSERSHDAKVLFALQLARRGYAVAIDDKGIPQALDRNQKFEIAPLLVEIPPEALTHLVIIGAENIDNETLLRLRDHALGPKVKIFCVGRFADLQALVGSRAKIAYALGREPQMLDLTDAEIKPLMDGTVAPLMAVGSSERPPSAVPQLFVYLPPEMLDEPMTLPILGAMDQLAGFRLNLIVTGKSKEQIRATRHEYLSVFSYTEISLTALADMADIVVFFGDSVPGEKMAALALDMMRSSKVVIDGTTRAALVSRGAPALRGPQDLAALPNYLDQTVLVNCAEIGRQAGISAWLKNHAIERLEQRLGLTPPDGPGPAKRLERHPDRDPFDHEHGGPDHDEAEDQRSADAVVLDGEEREAEQRDHGETAAKQGADQGSETRRPVRVVGAGHPQHADPREHRRDGHPSVALEREQRGRPEPRGARVVLDAVHHDEGEAEQRRVERDVDRS